MGYSRAFLQITGGTSSPAGHEDTASCLERQGINTQALRLHVQLTFSTPHCESCSLGSILRLLLHTVAPPSLDVSIMFYDDSTHDVEQLRECFMRNEAARSCVVTSLRSLKGLHLVALWRCSPSSGNRRRRGRSVISRMLPAMGVEVKGIATQLPDGKER